MEFATDRLEREFGMSGTASTVSTIASLLLVRRFVNNCFPAGTQVATEQGAKPIERVAIGDRVWAYSFQAGAWELRSVLQTFSRPYTGDFIRVTVDGATLESTDQHPYWVEEGVDLHRRPCSEVEQDIPTGSGQVGRWVGACDLRVGDILVLRSGRRVAVSAVEVHPGSEEVYNFYVDGLHCYAVGHCAVLVHNASAPRPRTPAENRQARNRFKNNKEAARRAWEERTGQKWPTDKDGNPWPAEHTPPLKEGGDPMIVTPRDPATDPHMIRGSDGLTDYQRWGSGGTPAREANKAKGN